MSNLRDRPAVAVLDPAFSARNLAPPPRDPRRVRRSVRASSARSSSSSVSKSPASTGDKDGYIASMSTSSDAKRASRLTHQRAALEDVSPPSSPDVATGEYSYVCDEVSPIDEYDDLEQSYYMTGVRSAHESENGRPNRARSHHRQHSSHSSRPRSHQMQFGPAGGHKEVEKHASPKDQDKTDVQHEQQMNIGSQGDRRLASHKPSPEAVQPGRRGRTTPNAPLTIQQKRRSQLENSQSNSSRLSAVEIPDFPKVPSSATAIRDEGSQTAKTRRGPLLLSKPLPEPRDHQDTPGGIKGRPNSHYRNSTLSSIGPAQPLTTSSAQPLSSSRVSPNQANAIKRKPPPPAPKRQGSHSPSPSPMHLDAPRRASASVIPPSSERARSPGIDSAWKRPSSRFSVISQVTMNAETSTQPEINVLPSKSPEPAPAVSMNQNSSVPDQHEVENPVMSLMSSQTTTPKGQSIAESDLGQDEAVDATSHSRKDSQAHVRQHARFDSVISVDKPLPLAPPEMSAAAEDRIAHLHATLSGLAHRRINTIKSIQQMTELIPSDNLLRGSDLVKRRELEKKKVEGLKDELYEIQRQEHELGLKLHRAYKRQERESLYEPTTLWVRRRAGEWIDE